MKVKIKSYENAYRIDTSDGRYMVRHVNWNGIPVDIDYLVLDVETLEIDDNSAHLIL